MSPVCSKNSGAIGNALILSTAACSVAATSGFAALLNPMWLSLICAKLNCPLMASGFISDSRLMLYDFKTPPCITQNAPVPAQAMHFKKPRRSTPSLLWSCTISSFTFPAIFLPPVDTRLANTCEYMHFPLIWQERRGLERARVPAPLWDVFHLSRLYAAARYSHLRAHSAKINSS